MENWLTEKSGVLEGASNRLPRPQPRPAQINKDERGEEHFKKNSNQLCQSCLNFSAVIVNVVTFVKMKPVWGRKLSLGNSLPSKELNL